MNSSLSSTRALNLRISQTDYHLFDIVHFYCKQKLDKVLRRLRKICNKNIAMSVIDTNDIKINALNLPYAYIIYSTTVLFEEEEIC